MEPSPAPRSLRRRQFDGAQDAQRKVGLNQIDAPADGAAVVCECFVGPERIGVDANAARVAAVDQLADYPQLGHPVPELQVPEIREVLVGNYRVVYRLEFIDVVEVVTVCHGARLLRLKDGT